MPQKYLPESSGSLWKSLAASACVVGIPLIIFIWLVQIPEKPPSPVVAHQEVLETPTAVEGTPTLSYSEYRERDEAFWTAREALAVWGIDADSFTPMRLHRHSADEWRTQRIVLNSNRNYGQIRVRRENGKFEAYLVSDGKQLVHPTHTPKPITPLTEEEWKSLKRLMRKQEKSEY